MKPGQTAATTGALAGYFDPIFVAIFTSHPLGRAVVAVKYSGYPSATSEGLEGILSGGFSSAR
jgi:hypothetical protein